MFVGMLVMVFAFIVAAIVQRTIQVVFVLFPIKFIRQNFYLQGKAAAMPVRFNTNIFNGYNCTIMLNHNNVTIETDKVTFPCFFLN